MFWSTHSNDLHTSLIKLVTAFKDPLSPLFDGSRKIAFMFVDSHGNFNFKWQNKRLIGFQTTVSEFLHFTGYVLRFWKWKLGFCSMSINFKGLQILTSLTLSVSNSEADLALLESSLNSFDLTNFDIKEVSNLLISG